MTKNRRHRILFAALLAPSLAAAAACANSDDAGAPPTEAPVEGGVLVLDGAPGDAADAARDAAPPTCSGAGWCKTELPDSQLEFYDIWPFATRAFAIAGSEDQGIKVLEWDGVAWSFIDDGSQNGFRAQPLDLWAPNENEIYYALVDIPAVFVGDLSGGQLVFHGTRSAPGASWSWSYVDLPCPYFASTGWVSGSSAGDVYSIGCARISHRDVGGDAGSGDGGAPPWTVVHADDDATNPVLFQFISGTGPNDLWFAGTRGACLVLLRKTAAGIQTVVDSTVNADGSCQKKATYATVRGSLLGLTTPTAGVATVTFDDLAGGPLAEHVVARITPESDGGVAVERRSPPASLPSQLGRLWGATPDSLWTIANSLGVIRATNPWVDTGVFTYSSTVINGAPNTLNLASIRGVSDNNLWIVGTSIALHKMSP